MPKPKEWSVLLAEKKLQLEQADDKVYKMRQQKETLETFISQFKSLFERESDLMKEEQEICANSDVSSFLNSQFDEAEDDYYKRYRTLLSHQETFETSFDEQSKRANQIEKELTALEKEACL